jgi:hypothetical protein
MLTDQCHVCGSGQVGLSRLLQGHTAARRELSNLWLLTVEGTQA